jgi:hypothetical protein
VGAGLVVALLADISIVSEKAKLNDGHTRLGVAGMSPFPLSSILLFSSILFYLPSHIYPLYPHPTSLHYLFIFSYSWRPCLCYLAPVVWHGQSQVSQKEKKKKKKEETEKNQKKLTKARYYLLTGTFIEAKEAERIGLISVCVPQEQVLPKAMEVLAFFWFLVFGFWFLVFGFWFLVFGFWFLVFGFWFLVFGFWFLVFFFFWFFD